MISLMILSINDNLEAERLKNRIICTQDFTEGFCYSNIRKSVCKRNEFIL
jgi:hypothetical protein